MNEYRLPRTARFIDVVSVGFGGGVRVGLMIGLNVGVDEGIELTQDYGV